MSVNTQIQAVTRRIIERSKPTRQAYLAQVDEQIVKGPHRSSLSCSNLAHGFAAYATSDKVALAGNVVPNLGIITAYNDMLSAHQSYKDYPDLIKRTTHDVGGVAQIASGVPTPCAMA